METEIDKDLIEKSLKDEQFLSEQLKGLLSKKDPIRSSSFKLILHLAENHPEVLYPKWDFLEGLLDSVNTYHKYQAIYIIASLTRVDINQKFEKIFDKYFALLNDDSIIPPSHLALNSPTIVKAKPHLLSEIVQILLAIDETNHIPQRKALIKSYVIQAFSQFFEEIDEKQKVLDFVEQQLNSSSPKTKKIAKQFLKKWNL